MDKVPSILMLAWNRREYFERTIAHLLADPSDYRIYIWDNASSDGLTDLIADLDDDRIVAKEFSSENVGQAKPWHWFLEACAGDIAGKLDDDILGERGWMSRFAAMVAEEPQLGTLGAWVFLESDWDEERGLLKVECVGTHQLFTNPWVGGCIFLARLEYLRKYSKKDPNMLGVPIDQIAMYRAGLKNGFPFPISFAENLDDPRSPHCRMNRPGGWDQFAAYTARMRDFSSPEEYGRWIAGDARKMLEMSVAEQLRMVSPTRLDRARSKLTRVAARLGLRRP